MIRIEFTTKNKSGVMHEGTIEEAKAYVKSMQDAGVEFLKVEYFDRDSRVSNIREGKV